MPANYRKVTKGTPRIAYEYVVVIICRNIYAKFYAEYLHGPA